ncbi:hypothetical protein IP88_01435 [alpha proteobacterium AAP81b]|nr:hypothetical protein IP88_01435 [alpha proteobacterium AAP81b]
MSDASTASARDAGLVRGIGSIGLTGNFLGILFGAGIYAIPSSMAAALGPWAALAYLGCALAVGATMICFAEAAARVPTSGGPYGFVAAAFGPWWGFVTGALIWASSVLAAGGTVAASADAAALLWPPLKEPALRGAAILGWALLLMAINGAGVGIMARFVASFTFVKLVPVLIFLGVGVIWLDPGNLALPLAAGHADIGRAAILGFFLFTGLETALAVGGEVRDPSRTIPRAMGLALLLAALLSIAIHLVAAGLLGDALGASATPLADAMARISPGLQWLLVIGTIGSMLGFSVCDALSSPRTLFAFARDGLLPRTFGRLHATRHTPVAAIVAHGAVVALLAITGSFAGLVALSSLLVVAVYILGTLAALRLRRGQVALAGPVTATRWLWPAAAASLGAMLWLTAQSTRDEAFAIAAFLGVVALVYALRRRAPAA